MTKSRFKEIYETNRNDAFQICYLVFIESGGTKIDRETFDSLFSMWSMMQGGVHSIIEKLKIKHEVN